MTIVGEVCANSKGLSKKSPEGMKKNRLAIFLQFTKKLYASKLPVQTEEKC